MPSSKTYVLDSSVLLSHGKQALSSFGRHEVVIPLVVIKELEGKRQDPINGWIARSVLRALESLRLKGSGHSLSTGVTVNDEGGTVRIEVNHIDQACIPVNLRDGRHDTRILAVAKNLQEDGHKVILVSNDLPMRLLAEVTLQLDAEPFKTGFKPQGDYSGMEQLEVDNTLITELFKSGSIPVSEINLPSSASVNTGVVLTAGRSSALAVRRDDTLYVVHGDRPAFGAQGRSAEQKIALEHLLDVEVPIVSLGGPAGTGKTLLALAAGLEQCLEHRGDDGYNKVIVFRPLHAVGNQNLGYLPGTEDEKMNPWAAAVYDALEAVTTKATIEAAVRQGRLEVLPVTHIRGRTLNKAFIIVDEAQNLERSTLLTVLSRLGQGSKAVFSWDASQRDNLSVGRHEGIVPIVDFFKNQPEFAHIALRKSERSRVAELATQALDALEY